MKNVNVYVNVFTVLATAYRDPAEISPADVSLFLTAVREPLRLFGVTMWAPNGDELLVKCDGLLDPERIDLVSHNRACLALCELGKLVITRAGVEQLSLQDA